MGGRIFRLEERDKTHDFYSQTHYCVDQLHEVVIVQVQFQADGSAMGQAYQQVRSLAWARQDQHASEPLVDVEIVKTSKV